MCQLKLLLLFVWKERSFTTKRDSTSNAQRPPTHPWPMLHANREIVISFVFFNGISTKIAETKPLAGLWKLLQSNQSIFDMYCEWNYAFINECFASMNHSRSSSSNQVFEEAENIAYFLKEGDRERESTPSKWLGNFTFRPWGQERKRDGFAGRPRKLNVTPNHQLICLDFLVKKLTLISKTTWQRVFWLPPWDLIMACSISFRNHDEVGWDGSERSNESQEARQERD